MFPSREEQQAATGRLRSEHCPRWSKSGARLGMTSSGVASSFSSLVFALSAGVAHWGLADKVMGDKSSNVFSRTRTSLGHNSSRGFESLIKPTSFVEQEWLSMLESAGSASMVEGSSKSKLSVESCSGKNSSSERMELSEYKLKRFFESGIVRGFAVTSTKGLPRRKNTKSWTIAHMPKKQGNGGKELNTKGNALEYLCFLKLRVDKPSARYNASTCTCDNRTAYEEYMKLLLCKSR